MKVVVVGGSKIVIGIIVVFSLLAGAVLLLYQLSIRPFDRINAKVQAVCKTDPDKCLALYHELWAEVERSKLDDSERGVVYRGLGRLLKEHGRPEQAMENFDRAIQLSHNSWHGIIKSCAMLDLAECKLSLQHTKKISQSDIDALLPAGTIHPPVAGGEDNWFWPAYEQALGRMYASVGDYPNAFKHLQMSIEHNRAMGADNYYVQQGQGWILDALVRQGKYVEANKKYIEFAGALPENNNGSELKAFFCNSLRRAQDKEPGFRTRVHTMLLQKKFAELDKLADERRSSKKILASGRWSINDLDDAVDSLEHSDFESIWQENLDLLREWVKTRPDSATAKVALGQLLTSYAWKARGNGSSDTVTEAGWKSFADRLAQAKGVFDQVKNKPPEWYSAMQRCALGQSWDTEKYDAMVAECRHRYPDYDVVIFIKCYRLQPRLFGKEGEFESYLTAEADKRPAVAGDILYAREAWYIDHKGIVTVMQDTKLSWPRVRSGLNQIIKQYPDSLLAKGILSTLAIETNDKKPAEAAFGSADK